MTHAVSSLVSGVLLQLVEKEFGRHFRFGRLSVAQCVRSVDVLVSLVHEEFVESQGFERFSATGPQERSMAKFGASCGYPGASDDGGNRGCCSFVLQQQRVDAPVPLIMEE